MRMVAIVALVVVGCASSRHDTQANKYSLSTIDSLKLGEQKMGDVSAILGPPSESFDLSKIASARRPGIVWQYSDAGYPRVSAFYDDSVLKSVTWKVRDGDPEQNIEVVKKRYPGKRWAVSVVSPSTPHSQPELCRLTSEKPELAIDVRASLKQVTSITRSLAPISPDASFEMWRSDLCGFLK